jgi:hypothetical protein
MLPHSQNMAVLRSLDVQVKLYPTKSEYVRVNGKRWDFLFNGQSRLLKESS